MYLQAYIKWSSGWPDKLVYGVLHCFLVLCLIETTFIKKYKQVTDTSLYASTGVITDVINSHL